MQHSNKLFPNSLAQKKLICTNLIQKLSWLETQKSPAFIFQSKNTSISVQIRKCTARKNLIKTTTLYNRKIQQIMKVCLWPTHTHSDNTNTKLLVSGIIVAAIEKTMIMILLQFDSKSFYVWLWNLLGYRDKKYKINDIFLFSSLRGIIFSGW